MIIIAVVIVLVALSYIDDYKGLKRRRNENDRWKSNSQIKRNHNG